MQNISTTFKISSAATAAASTSAEVNSSIIDTQGYDGVCFVVPLSAGRIVKLQGGSTSTAAATDITGCSVTTTAAGNVIIEMHRPQYRYVRATTVTGAAAVVGDTVVILGPARSKAVSNSNSVIVGTTTD